MAKRAHVVYAHLMRWEPLNVPNSKGRAWIKTQNLDPDTGARSALIKYERGFSHEGGTSEFPADILLLEGEMTCGDRKYTEGTYHFRPKGSSTGPVHTETGCTRLIWSEDDPEAVKAQEEIFIQDYNVLDWAPSYTNPGDPEKGCTKILREDKEARVTVLISGAFKPDMVLDGKADVHDHVEEVYTIDGEIEDYFGDVDGHIIWKPGMYVYRQPFTSAHGDVLKTKLPQMIFVKRGWAGETTEFYESGWKDKQQFAIKKPEYAE
jgi:hypothetical protein